jgi:hypothetical protein
VTVAKTWAASKDRDRKSVPALRGPRTEGGLPKNIHIWSKLIALTARGLPPPLLAPGNQASAPFFNLDPAGQLSLRILEHLTLIGVKPWKPLIKQSHRR